MVCSWKLFNLLCNTLQLPFKLWEVSLEVLRMLELIFMSTTMEKLEEF